MCPWQHVGQQLSKHCTPKPSLCATRHMATKPQKTRQAKAAPTSTRRGTTAKEAHTSEHPILSSPDQHREALRSAQAREAALRVARMRRLDERENCSQEVVEDKLKRDSFTGRYKSASRKWISTIVALPILLVTSYYLFDRREFAHCWLTRVLHLIGTGHF